MKTLLFLLLFIPASLNAQIFVHVGSSPLKGTAGIEIQPLQHFSIGAGYRYTYLWSAGNINSFSGSLSYYFRIEPALLYVSCGYASKGIVTANDYGMWTNPVAAQYLMFGTRYYPHDVIRCFPKRISFDIGMGYSISRYTSPELVIEFELNFTITRLRNKR